MSARPSIATVVASAGTGKTTRIVGDIAREVAQRLPEKMLATTFTVKAADELIERARARLFETGQADSAARLLGARFGTVNSVCAQIAGEHAFDLGLSPQVGVVPEKGGQRLLAIAAAAAFENHAATLNPVGERFGHDEPRFGTEPDRGWRPTVFRIIELARANGLDPEALGRSADHSVQAILALLPQPAGTEQALDGALGAAVSRVIPLLRSDLSKGAKNHFGVLHGARRAARDGEPVSWPDWCRLTKIACARADGPEVNDAFDDVRRAASVHLSHPRLRSDIETFISGVFACAAESLEAFARYKAERGLLDFVDQETLALEVLRTEGGRERLAEQIDRVFVDEFQDSSPLQVAIFTALAGLVSQSTWVGDPKQAIYGFRSADSVLTQAAFEGVRQASGAAPDVLSESWRSREGIVDFVNAAFGPAFAAMGLPESEHAFTRTRRTEEGFARPPLSIWWLQGKVDDQFGALAAKVRSVVADAEAWPVGVREGGTRAVRAGDIAILCRSGANVNTVARHLAAQGLKVAVEREGLADTPHIQLVVAAMRWVADRSDRLALAELARFFAEDPGSDAWLQAAADDDATAALQRLVPMSAALETLRTGLLTLTPAEIVDRLLAEAEVRTLIARWGDVIERLDDCEALRGFARTYEDTCGAEGVPATLSGLILMLEADPPKQPSSLHPDAVRVMTYHAAKGLEWPLVILTGLDRDPWPRLFDAVAEAEGEIDWQAPLANRRIRFWPWPYGSQKKDTGLDAIALSSRTGVLAEQRAREEETRLLYVGMTRARDYLVLAPPDGKDAWLRVLDTEAGLPHLRLPDAGADALCAGACTFPVECLELTTPSEAIAVDAVPAFLAHPKPAPDLRPLHRRPSGESSTSVFVVQDTANLGPRIPLTGTADMQRVGDAVHAVLAADDPSESPETRVELARDVLARWSVTQVDPASVILGADRLGSFIAARWPGARIRREVPVFARIDGQLISGRIDLLVEAEDGFAVIDHKSFPGGPHEWQTRSIGHGPQLALYAQAIGVASGKPCRELWIHMVLGGKALKVGRA
jgi:ATP-dependent exoDNAse (exonuclease V) beta subunit